MGQHLPDNFTDILFQQASYVTWVPYNKLHVSNYRKFNHDKMSNVVVLKVESQNNTYTLAIWSKYLADSNEMKALDKQAWAANYNSEFVGFQQRKVFVFLQDFRKKPNFSPNDSIFASSS